VKRVHHDGFGDGPRLLGVLASVDGIDPSLRQQLIDESPLFLVIREEPRTGVNAGHFGIVVSSSEEIERTALALQARGLAPERREAKLWLEDPDGNGWEIIVAR